MIDPKDLRPFKASELQIGGTFYLKVGEEFHTCSISVGETKGENRNMLRQMTKKYAQEGRLFVRINKPWGHFE